uniref:Peptidase A1 domain-containing protein n=1 Tax=Heterorhabditis bacteriophora TaxID=37862 RepID=A0A1I7XIQ4_HETBA
MGERFGAKGENQLIVPKTTFGLATHISSDFKDDPTDGILGLAFTSLAVDGVVPPLINAMNQNLLDQPLFTVWLEHRGEANNAPGGIFTYGAIDTTNCGPVIAYQHLSSATYYQFKANAFKMGTYSTTKSYQVISDTGTSFMCGPKSVTDALAKAAGATYDNYQESYFIPCDANPPTLDIVIGTNTYSIQSVNYIVNVAIPREFQISGIYDSGQFAQHAESTINKRLLEDRIKKMRLKMKDFEAVERSKLQNNRNRRSDLQKIKIGKNWTNLL